MPCLVSAEYGFLPHNSMVGLWSFTGLIGFSGIFSTVVVAMFLAARAHARSLTAEQAIASAAAIGCLCAYIVHLWADIGFTEAPTIFLVAIAMAIAADGGGHRRWPAQWRSGTAGGKSSHHIEHGSWAPDE